MFEHVGSCVGTPPT